MLLETCPVILSPSYRSQGKMPQLILPSWICCFEVSTSVQTFSVPPWKGLEAAGGISGWGATILPLDGLLQGCESAPLNRSMANRSRTGCAILLAWVEACERAGATLCITVRNKAGVWLLGSCSLGFSPAQSLYSHKALAVPCMSREKMPIYLFICFLNAPGNPFSISSIFNPEHCEFLLCWAEQCVPRWHARTRLLLAACSSCSCSHQ